MKTNITLEEALQKASRRLREKMIYSVSLLKKAENLALAYGAGFFKKICHTPKRHTTHDKD